MHPTYTPAGKGWLVQPSEHRWRTPEESASHAEDTESHAKMLGKARHLRTCHALGHWTHRQCERCKAKRCDVCATPSEERAPGAVCKRVHTPAGERLPCYQVRCDDCTRHRCTRCAPEDCPSCYSEADRSRGRERALAGREASAFLRSHGFDPWKVEPPPPNMLPELVALLHAQQATSALLQALAAVLP